MYQIGDLVIYGSTGVCRIENISRSKDIPTLRCLKEDSNYYILEPLYQNGTIYTPVDNPKVFMRSVISREEAETLIDYIPTVKAEGFFSQSMSELKEHYEAATRTHNCTDLIKLVMSIYAKKRYVEQQNHKFGQIDERYMKQAEEMLSGEFSVALGIAKDEVQSYVTTRVTALQGDVELNS
ncbi:MAG: CarD family transcriptional regulator [Oscillospiraceae bacterium]